MSLVEDVRVVIRELLARGDVADRLDPDATVVDDRIAVRIARVIDEPRVVAVDGGVDHDVVVDREEKRVVSLINAIGVTGIRGVGCETLAGIFDETRSRWNATRGERAQSLHGRRTNLERRILVRHDRSAQCGVFRDSTCVTPPEMMYAMTAAASASIR